MKEIERKARLLSDYLDADRVLRWLKDNDLLKGDDDLHELATWYAASAATDRAWINEQIQQAPTKKPSSRKSHA